MVMPFKDTCEFIERALYSIASQTFTDYEVLMLDNMSSDGSRGIAAEYAAMDSRFRLLDCPGSFVSALNTGLGQARGKWIARFDSDDICHPERLMLQHRAGERLGERTIITSRVRCFPDELVSRGYRRYESWINTTETPEDIEHSLFIESPVPHPTAFYSRNGVIEAGGYRDIGLPEDYELWLRLWSIGYRFHRVPKTLLAWRERKERFSRSSPMYSLTSFYKTKARYLEHVPCLSKKRVYIAGTGQCARRLSGHMKREGFSIAAFLAPVEKVTRPLLRGAPVIPGSAWDHHDGIPVLGASREPGARQRIKAFLEGRGLVNWRDFVLCS